MSDPKRQRIWYPAGWTRAGQGRAGQGRAGQGRPGQDRAGQGRAGQGRAGSVLCEPKPSHFAWVGASSAHANGQRRCRQFRV